MLKSRLKQFVCIAMRSLVMLWNSYYFEQNFEIVLFVFTILVHYPTRNLLGRN